MHCSHCTSSPITVDPEDFQPQEIGILKVSATFANITEPVNVVHMYEDNMFSIKVIYIMLTLNLATTRDWHPQKFQQHFQTKLNQSIYCYCYWNVNTDDHIRFREREKIWSIWYCFQSVKKSKSSSPWLRVLKAGHRSLIRPHLFFDHHAQPLNFRKAWRERSTRKSFLAYFG